MDQLLREAEILHRAGNRGQLAGAPEHIWAFSPGLRTRDDGELGDASGEIMINPLAPDGARWRLFLGERLVASGETSARQPLRLLATRGGQYLLTMHDPNTDNLLGQTLVSIPQFVYVYAPVGTVAPSLAELHVPPARQQAVWDAILGAARPICHHILRPANVRLIWSEDDLPEFFTYHQAREGRDAPLSPVEGYNANTADGPRKIYRVPTNVILASPASALCGAANFVDKMGAVATDYAAIFGAALSPLQVFFPQFMAEPEGNAAARHGHEPAWGFDGAFSALDVGIARAGLGAFDFAGARIAEAGGTDVDLALAALAFTTDAAGARSPRIDWADPASAPYRRFVELAGRQVGVFAARTTLRMIGIPVEAAGHVTAEGGDDVVIGGILAPVPHAPLQDILGLHRPLDRAFDQLSADLDNQQARAANAAGVRNERLPEVETRWADLVALEKAGIRTERAMPGPMSAYDALTGMVSDASINSAHTLLGTLPSAYGPYELRPGDRDTAIEAEPVPVYGGLAQPEGRPADDIIRVLQRDLHAIGIGQGLPGPEAGAAQQYNGFYGYRRFVPGNQKYDGDLAERPGRVNRAEVKYGHSEWAVREFQIASSYPNSVAEKIGVEAHYAARLHILNAGADPRAPDQAPENPVAIPSSDINGRLTVLEGERLRQWRFRRRRPPIVVMAGSNADPYTPPANLELGQNLNRLDGFNSITYRMYALDLSGYFHADPNPAPVRLGYYGAGGWGGPLATADHGIMSVTRDHSIGAMEPNPIADFYSAYRVAAAVGFAESSGYFDGFNAWDDSVFSYLLFHHTLTLTGNANDAARPGQMAGFVRWLQDPPAALMEAVFPDAGGDVPNHPDPYPVDQQGVTELRDRLRARFHEVFTNAFGFFGVGASATRGNPLEGFITAAGHETGTTPAGNAVDMRITWPGRNAVGLRQQALYQAYQQWFRTWPWFYRFAAAIRNDPALRTMVFAYELDWIQRRLEGVVDDIRTERGRAAYIRVAVRGSNFSTNHARDAVIAARRQNPGGDIDEGQVILDAIIAGGGYNGLSGSTLRALNYNSPDTEPRRLDRRNRQSNDIYRRVRNDILRRLIAG